MPFRGGRPAPIFVRDDAREYTAAQCWVVAAPGCPSGDHGVVCPRAGPSGLRAAAGPGRLQHEFPLARDARSGHRGCRDPEGPPCWCTSMPPLRPPVWRAGLLACPVVRSAPARAVGTRPGTRSPAAGWGDGAAAPGAGTLPLVLAHACPAAGLVRAPVSRCRRGDRHRARRGRPPPHARPRRLSIPRPIPGTVMPAARPRH
jgi:hypothetical protein